MTSRETSKPLAVDLCCGLGGWTEGLLQEGYRARGYDIEAHEYGDERYPGELVLKSILDLDGAACADADLIVASPPCTEYSYMAMPWSRAKQIARALRGEDVFPDGYKGSRTLDELNALFNACFRIQREASQAAGRYIPMVVENVRGAQPWVGRAAANFGSYYLWGDVPALMPTVVDARKVPGFRFDGSGRSFQTASVEAHVAVKVPALDGGRRTDKGKGARFTSRDCGVEREVAEGRKGAGAGAGAEWFDQNLCKLSSKSPARKAASAKIAKIPLALSSHIARVYRPQTEAAA
ncbi:DNA cytosine methyltransferase [Phenylobacterium sp.]|uniref:DNA cytosine methyltransferase n=1 Tax=Phenylobacterium sp. TaxID=1871053 RepID=UPI002731179A|nr:DNA cytosine methyltransferase [Phenylobacterium sp.]MDP1873675.1 DNA cytosine methyltransferase [Phenylobacterium sp.]